MTWKDGRKIIAARRERVAQLRLRGLTMREIVAALPRGDNPMLNPETGQPFSLGCIAGDLKELSKQWQANAERDITEHKSEQLAELAEVKRAAWAAKHLETVLRALQQEAKILGIEAPTKVEASGPDGGPLTVKHDFSDDQVADILRVLAGIGAFQPGSENGGDSKTQ